MNSSKIVVLAIGFFILAGVGTWTWVNFTQNPPHDPEIAQRYFQHFVRTCPLAFADELAATDRDLCREALGEFHRTCFADHLRPTPPESIDDDGPFVYNRSLYLECMKDGVRALSAQTR